MWKEWGRESTAMSFIQKKREYRHEKKTTLYPMCNREKNIIDGKL